MLFKQYSIWLPRLWLLLLFLIISAVAVFFGLRNLAYYLALTEPKNGDYLIVEGWVSEGSLDKALNIFINGRYQYLITTGGLDKHCKQGTYAEKSASYFISKGFPAEKIIIIPTPESAQARTFLSAVMVREWLYARSIDNVIIDVFTEGVHARRTRYLYNLAFRPSVDVGIYAAAPSKFQLSTWWKTSEGAKSTITELFGYLWTVFFFEAAELNSHKEKWGSMSPTGNN